MTEDSREAMGEIEVRPARRADVPALVILLNRIIVVGGTTAMETELDESGFASLYLTGDDVLSCYVAIDPHDGTLAGFQGLARDHRLPEGWADVATFARMEPKLRGVGTALFVKTAERARDHGIATINAAIRADNHQGLQYYEKMGFSTWQTLPDVPLQNGLCVDRIFKRFDFNDQSPQV